MELQLNASKTWKWPSNLTNGDVDWDEVPTSGYYNNFEIVKLEEFKKPEVEEWFYHLVQYPAGFTSGVGVSVYLKGDIRLITDAFLFFLFDNRRRAASVGDNADFVRYGARYATALRDPLLPSVQLSRTVRVYPGTLIKSRIISGDF